MNGIITPLFDINPSVNSDGTYPALHEKGLIGSFLKGLFGYNGNPSLLEVISYVSYLSVIFFLDIMSSFCIARFKRASKSFLSKEFNT